MSNAALGFETERTEVRVSSRTHLVERTTGKVTGSVYTRVWELTTVGDDAARLRTPDGRWWKSAHKENYRRALKVAAL